MKNFKRAHHHRRRLELLTAQYTHLDTEQREENFEADVLKLATVLDPVRVVRILDKIAEKLRVHR